MALDLVGALQIQAAANRLANRRLHETIAGLPHDDFHAARTSFFPSFAATLNHILAVDLYYVGALHGEPVGRATWAAFVPADSIAELAARQGESDERLIRFCAGLTAESVAAAVAMDRGTHVQRDLAGHVLAHLFMHQTHHRGQAHAMLSSTAAAPPQLDEFLMPSDAHFRVRDMQILGWQESEVYAPR